MSDKQITLYGRVFIEATIVAKTGLHIGGSGSDLEIGGLDKEVIRNPLTKRPYIPGSSLRGKMRSQMEKLLGLPQNRPIGQVTIHTCKTKTEFEKNGGCQVCTVFGVPAEMDYDNATRLVVRDAELTDDSAEKLNDARTDLLYAELKTEVAIDRVTSAATPRTMERVPADAEFGPTELVFSIYEAADYDRLKTVIDALQLVEDDYLGGSGSRGYGKVEFTKIKVYARNGKDYGKRQEYRKFGSVQELADDLENLKNWLATTVPTA
ncbi:MAG: type III-A CRISPR-associated RAMP protein Csm3 [Anaerolineales bacterium]